LKRPVKTIALTCTGSNPLFRALLRKISAKKLEMTTLKPAPFSIDLERQTVTLTATGEQELFEISPYKKECLLKGYDDVDYLMSIHHIDGFDGLFYDFRSDAVTG